MKYIFSLLAVVLFFASCEGPMGPRGPQGSQGEGMNWEIIDLTATPSGWERVYDRNGLFLEYRCIFDLPEMSEFVYDKGAYLTYVRLPEGNSEIQQILPVTIDNEYNGYFWQRTIECNYMYEFERGMVKSTIAIVVRDSDFNEGAENLPGRMNFRVVLMW